MPNFRHAAGREILAGSPRYYEFARNLLGQNLIHYPGLHDASGAVARDLSFNYRNAAYVGAPVLGATGIGDGLSATNFNAVGELDSYSAGLVGAINFDTFFASFWVKMNSAANWTDGATYVAICFGASATYFYQLLTQAAGTLFFRSRRGATIVSNVFHPPTTTRWVHYAMVGNSAANTISFYRNGSKTSSTSGLGGAWVGALGANFARLANNSPAISNNPWPGQFQHFVLCNTIPSDYTIWQLSQSIGQLVIDGDSRSGGRSWPSTALEAARSTGNIAYGQYGLSTLYAVSGKGVFNMVTNFSTELATCVFHGNKNIALIWGGINDAAGGQTVNQILANIQTICGLARTAGYKVILCTEIDGQSAGLNAVNWHTIMWPALNALILAGWTAIADALVNLGADVRLQNALDLTYFNADAIHPNATGDGVIAGLVTPVLASIM